VKTKCVALSLPGLAPFGSTCGRQTRSCAFVSGNGVATRRASRAAAGIRYNRGNARFRDPKPIESRQSRLGDAKPALRAFSSFSTAIFEFISSPSTAAIMADNVEHVISYWVIFQKFHSPALAGFAVISHWVPFLFFAAFSGALADRFDVRRLIQIGTASCCSPFRSAGGRCS